MTTNLSIGIVDCQIIALKLSFMTDNQNVGKDLHEVLSNDRLRKSYFDDVIDLSIKKSKFADDRLVD